MFPQFCVHHDGMKVGGICPPPNRKKDFEMSVFFLEFVKSFKVAIEVCSGFIPRVIRIMNILVSPQVRQIDFARVWLNIGEGVEDMSGDQVRNPAEWLSYRNRREIINRDERRSEFAAINSPICTPLTRCNLFKERETIPVNKAKRVLGVESFANPLKLTLTIRYCISLYWSCRSIPCPSAYLVVQRVIESCQIPSSRQIQ